MGLGAQRQSSPQPGGARASVVAQFYGGVVIAGFLLHALTQNTNDFWHVSPDRELPFSWPQNLLIGAFVGLLVVAGFRLLGSKMAWVRELHAEFQSILGRPKDVEILLLAAVSALGEEIFFRAALLDLTGIWVSSLIFALVHLPPRLSLWPWTLSAGVMGCLFAWLTQFTGDLGAAIVAHFVINWLNLWFIARANPTPA